MSEVKYCKDCKHFGKRSGEYYTDASVRCLRIGKTQLEPVNLVTGTVRIDYPLFCSLEREGIATEKLGSTEKFECCGPEGKFFEPFVVS